MFTGRQQLKLHLMNECPDQKLKCADCSKQVSKGSKAKHKCVPGLERVIKAKDASMVAKNEEFKRKLMAKDAKIALGDEMLAKTIAEMQELTSSGVPNQSSAKNSTQGDDSKVVASREFKVL